MNARKKKHFKGGRMAAMNRLAVVVLEPEPTQERAEVEREIEADEEEPPSFQGIPLEVRTRADEIAESELFTPTESP